MLFCLPRSGFVSQDNRELLEEALGVLSARIKGNSQDQLSFKESLT